MAIGTPTALTPTTTNVTSYTVPSDIPAGSVVALAVMDSPSPGAAASYSATDSKGNTYTGGTSYWENTGSIVWVYGKITTALVGGTDSWSFTKGGASVQVYVVPVVCTGLSGTADGSTGGLQSGGTGNNTWNTGSGVATGNADDLLLLGGMYCHGGGALTETPPAGYTDFTPAGSYFSGWSQGIFVAYQIVSATGTYAPTGTYSAATNGNAAEILALQGSGGGTNATINAVSAQIRLRAYGASVSTVTPVNTTVNAPSAQARARTGPPALLTTSSSLQAPSAQARARAYGATVATGSSATITAPSAQLRVRTPAPSVTTTSGASIQASAAQIRVRTSPPSLASSSTIKGTSAQVRARSYGIAVSTGANIPEICFPTTLTLASATNTLTLTARTSTLALTGPDSTLDLDSDPSTLSLTIC